MRKFAKEINILVEFRSTSVLRAVPSILIPVALRPRELVKQR